MKQVIIKIGIGFGLFALDAVIFHTCLIAIMVATIWPVLLIRALFAWKNKDLLKKRLITCGILAVTVMMIIIVSALNRQVTLQRAQIIIAACQKYQADHGNYPDGLTDLIPRYLERLPRLNYTLNGGKVHYLVREGHHQLVFATLPPFGRDYYILEENRWGQTD
ncbi:MAG: hypothetical protein HQK55_15445 [Deltaproteobacteria bacterium]|nr:hypothetical protein [Deltaproteobacteria bacterium]